VYWQFQQWGQRRVPNGILDQLREQVRIAHDRRPQPSRGLSTPSRSRPPTPSVVSTYYVWRERAEQPCDRDLVPGSDLEHPRSETRPGTPTAPTGCTGSYAVTGSGWAVSASTGSGHGG
jgi:hypothetical protein